MLLVYSLLVCKLLQMSFLVKLFQLKTGPSFDCLLLCFFYLNKCRGYDYWLAFALLGENTYHKGRGLIFIFICLRIYLPEIHLQT